MFIHIFIAMFVFATNAYIAMHSNGSFYDSQQCQEKYLINLKNYKFPSTIVHLVFYPNKMH